MVRTQIIEGGNMAKFSWCFASSGHEYHKKCPVQLKGYISKCTCECHSVKVEEEIS